MSVNYIATCIVIIVGLFSSLVIGVYYVNKIREKEYREEVKKHNDRVLHINKRVSIWCSRYSKKYQGEELAHRFDKYLQKLDCSVEEANQLKKLYFEIITNQEKKD